jgi:hypothetical protein
MTGTLGRGLAFESRSTFRSLAIAGGAPRAELDLITHPSPREAADLYTRLEVVWPAMCRAVQAVQLAPERPADATAGGLASGGGSARRGKGKGPSPQWLRALRGSGR